MQLADSINDAVVNADGLKKMNTHPDDKPGDVNHDKKVDATDKNLIMQHISETKMLASTVLWYADYNGDGIINMVDAVLLCNNYYIA